MYNNAKQKHNVKFNHIHKSFLKLLSDYYKSIRYDNLSIRGTLDVNQAMKALIRYISNDLKIPVGEESSIGEIAGRKLNSIRIKKKIGSIIGEMVIELYDRIHAEASKKDLFTYEISLKSKAGKIFCNREFNFFKERILWKELLIFLINTKKKTDVIGFIKNIKPLNFDPELILDYLKSFQFDLNKLEHIGELDALYEDILDKEDRRETLEFIEGTNVLSSLNDYNSLI